MLRFETARKMELIAVKILAPLLALCALAACAGTAGGASTPARSGAVAASVAHSEWSRSGYVTLELGSGRYRLIHQQSRMNPSAPVPTTSGRLAADELQPIRTAYAAARAEGLMLPACRNGGRAPQIVISNGGPRRLILDPEGARNEAPTERGCWTEPAIRLHEAVDAAFGARARASQ